MTISACADSKRTHLADPFAGGRRGDIVPSLDGLRAISIILVLIGHAIKAGPESFAFIAAFEHAGLRVNIFYHFGFSHHEPSVQGAL
jgi:hypothetical protein